VIEVIGSCLKMKTTRSKMQGEVKRRLSRDDVKNELLIS
jgi:hypothetical protein